MGLWGIPSVWKYRSSQTDREHRPQPEEGQDQRTSGIVERFHKPMLDELHRVVFGKKIYRSIHELQIDLDARIIECNVGRTHQGAGTNLPWRHSPGARENLARSGGGQKHSRRLIELRSALAACPIRYRLLHVIDTLEERRHFIQSQSHRPTLHRLRPLSRTKPRRASAASRVSALSQYDMKCSPAFPRCYPDRLRSIWLNRRHALRTPFSPRRSNNFGLPSIPHAGAARQFDQQAIAKRGAVALIEFAIALRLCPMASS